MPPIVGQALQEKQLCCFCGVFPEIKRAWASVDNRFFLWRFDRKYATYHLYSVLLPRMCSPFFPLQCILKNNFARTL